MPGKMPRSNPRPSVRAMRALFSITGIALSKPTNSYQQMHLKAIAFSSERMARDRQAQIDTVIAEFSTNKMETHFFTQARPARSLRDVDNTIASV
jgi:hypothetical protein